MRSGQSPCPSWACPDQEEIARAIVAALQVPLGNVPIAQATATDVEAHNLYLLGRSHFNRFTEADLRKSLEKRVGPR